MKRVRTNEKQVILVLFSNSKVIGEFAVANCN